MDQAHSNNPALNAVLCKAQQLNGTPGIINLDRITRLCQRLGNPQNHMPPVFHVAGTNGKGSTVAFLRACLEAAGYRTHVYTSPHLVRVNERIRVAGQFIDDLELASLLQDILIMNAGEDASFFELMTAAAFLAFSRTRADATILEVGMGGRLDATNIVQSPLICGIAQIDLDHQQWLGNTVWAIAGEKAAIARRGVPLVLSRTSKNITTRLTEVAATLGAQLILPDIDWDITHQENEMLYHDRHSLLHLPVPRLAGNHQIRNAGLAVAMLRHQSGVFVPEKALQAGMGWAQWPGRLQKLDTGIIKRRLSPHIELWVDGGHNPAASQAMAAYFDKKKETRRPFYLIVGMLAGKDLKGFLKPFTHLVDTLYAVEIPGHACHDPGDITRIGHTLGIKGKGVATLQHAIDDISCAHTDLSQATVLIGGSLHLVGQALQENGTIPC